MSTPMAGLLSPPASAASPSPSHANAHDPNGGLPTPRQHPLRPGSEKEIALMNYLDKKILHMSRRYGKKFTEPEDHDDSPGYTNMDQVVADAHDIFQLAWISGTPHLQTSYLLSLAGTILSYMPAFDFSTSIFNILSKLDSAFVSLVRPLPGINTNHASALSTTDKVRIKSLVEDTRVTAVNCGSSAGYSASGQDLSSDDDSDSEDEQDQMDDGIVPGDEAISIALSRIYKSTLEILGDSLT